MKTLYPDLIKLLEDLDGHVRKRDRQAANLCYRRAMSLWERTPIDDEHIAEITLAISRATAKMAELREHLRSEQPETKHDLEAAKKKYQHWVKTRPDLFKGT